MSRIEYLEFVMFGIAFIGFVAAIGLFLLSRHEKK